MAFVDFLQGIDSAAHTFISWFGKAWKAVEKDAPKIESYIEHGIDYAVTSLKIILSKLDPTSEAAKVIQQAIGKLLAISAAVFDHGAAHTVAEDFQAVVDNLNSIETFIGIKNTDLIANIGKVVNTIAPLIGMLLKLLPMAAVSAV